VLNELLMWAGDLGWNDFWRDCRPDGDFGYHNSAMRLGKGGIFT
jgi:hypothetical protein